MLPQDVFGTKRMLVCEVWVFIIGNIIAGTAHSLNQLVAGRLIAGVGGAGLLSLVTIIVSRTYWSHSDVGSQLTRGQS